MAIPIITPVVVPASGEYTHRFPVDVDGPLLIVVATDQAATGPVDRISLSWGPEDDPPRNSDGNGALEIVGDEHAKAGPWFVTIHNKTDIIQPVAVFIRQG